MPVHDQRALDHGQQPHGRAPDGRLTRAGLTHQAQYFSRGHGQTHVLNGAERGIAPLFGVFNGHVLELQHGFRDAQCRGVHAGFHVSRGACRVRGQCGTIGLGRHCRATGSRRILLGRRGVLVDGRRRRLTVLRLDLTLQHGHHVHGLAGLTALTQVGHRFQQRFGVGVLGRGEDLLGGALFDNPALLHHGNAVREVGHHAHVVGDQDDGRIQFVLEVPDQVQDFGLHGDVQGRGGLIGNQQLGIAGQ